MTDREFAWNNIIQSLRNAATYAAWLDNRNGEYDRILLLTDHFIRSAKWHKKQYD